MALTVGSGSRIIAVDSSNVKSQQEHVGSKPNPGRENLTALKSDVAPVFLVAEGLNADGSLIENYKRGLRYAADYFGNYGPYYIYL